MAGEMGVEVAVRRDAGAGSPIMLFAFAALVIVKLVRFTHLIHPNRRFKANGLIGFAGPAIKPYG